MRKIITKLGLLVICSSSISCGKTVNVTVVGEDGKAIQDVEVKVWSIGTTRSQDQKFEDRTNTQGLAVVKVKDDARRLTMYIEKKGYYNNTYKHSYGTAISVKNKSIVDVKTVLRKKIRPIPIRVNLRAGGLQP